ncbi:hypothetical protein QCB44_02435 [Thiomicrorhabdus sp. zzn3]|uniref:hypothetical protein n=1 Tax=Thiomicrorhabdus sp. zzn3 TaxID=3039775 RepID=UPI0024365CE8|nr:hypothetical protein [Thiomicrorhabdus sp. zzn3]MDG6777555.1 hypothetical protein [Thiomicrorhabdus sp. zzn3]
MTQPRDLYFYGLAAFAITVSALALFVSWLAGADYKVVLDALTVGVVILAGAAMMTMLFDLSAALTLNGASWLIWMNMRPVFENLNLKSSYEEDYVAGSATSLFQEVPWWSEDLFFYLFLAGIVVIFIAFFFRR